MHMCIRSAQKILAKYNIRMNVKHSGLLEDSIESSNSLYSSRYSYRILKNRSDKGEVTLYRIESKNACVDKRLQVFSTSEESTIE
jgi:hypothetical protein